MKKPFYSKRRLKKMGIFLVDKKDHYVIKFRISGCSLRQSVNFGKVLENLNKPVKAEMDGFISSMSSIICYDTNKLINKLYGYDNNRIRE